MYVHVDAYVNVYRSIGAFNYLFLYLCAQTLINATEAKVIVIKEQFYCKTGCFELSVIS